MAFDFADQRAKTLAAWSELSAVMTTPNSGWLRFRLDYLEDHADLPALTEALAVKGITVDSERARSGSITAKTGPHAIDLSEILSQESAITNISLEHGFAPRGWGIALDS